VISEKLQHTLDPAPSFQATLPFLHFFPLPKSVWCKSSTSTTQTPPDLHAQGKGGSRADYRYLLAEATGTSVVVFDEEVLDAAGGRSRQRWEQQVSAGL
jgi:hypothetical protein